MRALVPDAHRGEHHQPPPEAVHQSELSIAVTNHSPVLPVGEAPAAVGVPLGEVDQAAISGGVTGINKDMQAMFDDLRQWSTILRNGMQLLATPPCRICTFTIQGSLLTKPKSASG